MKGLVVALLWLLPVAASAVPVGGHRWPTTVIGPGRLPDGDAIVLEDCSDPHFTPCFETIQGAIDHVELVAPDSNTRHVHIFGKDDGSAWDETITCGLGASTGRGFTHLEGGGTKVAELAPFSHVQHDGPKLTATTGPVITMSDCGIRGFWIEMTDTTNPAILINGGDASAHIISSLIQNPYPTVLGVGNDNSLVELVRTPGDGSGGYVIIRDATILATCISFACNANSQALLINETQTGSASRVLVVGSVVGMQQANAVAGAAAVRIDQSIRTDIENSRVFCESGMTCFEVDDSAVVELNLFDLSAFGGLTTPHRQGRFMDINNTGQGSLIRLGNIDNSQAFFLASRWQNSIQGAGGGVANPQYIMGCQSPHSIEFAPDNTQVTYVTIGNANDMGHAGCAAFPCPAGVGHTPDPVEANVDNFILPRHAVVHGFTASVDVAPGAGASWDVQLRDDGATTSHTCNIDNPNTSCLSTDARDAESSAEGSRLNLMITPTSSPAGGEMIVRFCLSAFPQ